MAEPVRYSPIPGTAGRPGQSSTVMIINGTPVPAVPAGSCLLLLVGLVMWSVGMLQARSTVGGIFSDLGLEADSLNRLQATVLASVIVMTVLVLAVLVANAWLEVKRATGSKMAGPVPTLQAYCSNAFKLNIVNWCLLLLAALALAGSITWLTTMSTALSATQQTGGGFGSHTQTVPSDSENPDTVLQPVQARSIPSWPAAAVHSPQTATHSTSVLDDASAPAAGSAQPGKGGAEVPDVGQLWAYRLCPPGCVDLGLIAEVLGLPWPCFCQVWLLGDLVEQLQKVVAQLWVAVVGALLLFAAVSWLYGYLAAQGAHAEHDVQAAMAEQVQEGAGSL